MYTAGRASWLVALVLIGVAGGGFYLWQQPQSAGEQSASTDGASHPSLHADLYPLYPGVAWGAPSAASVTISTTTYVGASISAVAITSTMDPGSAFAPFDTYYDHALKALGWSVANDLAAGGPMGGQTGYRKAGATILTRFAIVYHTTSADAPSECPCDVTLSLFSTR